jgi:DNA repair exonuclease SbcCD ATPase subunit
MCKEEEAHKCLHDFCEEVLTHSRQARTVYAIKELLQMLGFSKEYTQHLFDVVYYYIQKRTMESDEEVRERVMGIIQEFWNEAVQKAGSGVGTKACDVDDLDGCSNPSEVNQHWFQHGFMAGTLSSEAQVNNLQLELESSKATIASLQKDLEEAKNRTPVPSSAGWAFAPSFGSSGDANKKKVEDLTAQCAQNLAKIQGHEAHIKQLTEELQNSKQRFVQVEKQNNEQDMQIKQLRQTLQQKDEDKEKLDKEVQQVDKAFTDEKQKLANCEQVLMKAFMEVKDMKKVTTKLEQDLQEKDLEIQRLQHRLAQPSAAAQQSANELAKLRQDLQNAHQTLQQNNGELQGLQQTLQKKDAGLQGLQQTLQQKNGELQALQDAQNALQQKNGELQQTLQKKDGELQALQDAQNALQQKNGELQQTLQQKDTDLQGLQGELSKAKNETHEEAEKHYKYKGMCSRTKESLKKAERKITALEEKLGNQEGQMQSNHEVTDQQKKSFLDGLCNALKILKVNGPMANKDAETIAASILAIINAFYGENHLTQPLSVYNTHTAEERHLKVFTDSQINIILPPNLCPVLAYYKQWLVAEADASSEKSFDPDDHQNQFPTPPASEGYQSSNEDGPGSDSSVHKVFGDSSANKASYAQTITTFLGFGARQ